MAAVPQHPVLVEPQPAIVVTGSEQWHQFRVVGDEQCARSKVSHLTFEEPEHVVFKPSGRHKTHQYIYVRNDKDATAIRLALPPD